jgi:hypothetical protein
MTRRLWLRVRTRNWTAHLVTGAVVALLAASAVADANGPCGQDSTGNTAFSLAFPSTSPGSLTTSNENDYYVFTAQAGEEIFATITGTESSSCNGCGFAEAGVV